MSKYQNKHIQGLFNISAPTVRTWADEFSEYLSPSANPPAHKTRYFTDEDVQVFATVSRMRDERASTDEIQTALADGIRDSLPVNLPKELIDITASDMGLQLIRELEQMRQDIEMLKSGDEEKQKLTDEIARLNRELGKLEALLEIERSKNSDS